MNPILDDVLMHRGVKRRSGRYPWGSGDAPYQRSGDWLSRVEELKKSGMSEADIYKSFGLSTAEGRRFKSLANSERRSLLAERARSLKEDGLTPTEIAKAMGFSNESSVRNLLKQAETAKTNSAKATADVLKKAVDEKGMVDVGKGVDKQLGISAEMLQRATLSLEMQGYKVYGVDVPQINNPGQNTTITVLAKPGTTYKEAYDISKIHAVQEDWVSHDGGATFDPAFVYPKSMSSKRLMVRYDEDGGSDKDGVVELRRGVPDLDLGGSHYSQVRILVDDTHYIKGMAVYGDNMPDGVDVIFNTNKKRGTPVRGPKNNTVLKNIKNDPDNPFGSAIAPGIIDPDNPGATKGKKGGQSYYYDKDGKKQLSLINKREDEGGWEGWANKVPSQFLSKQNDKLYNTQLNLTLANRRAELDEIRSLTNPALKRSMLESFAGDCDSSAVHLRAAALPRQKYQVILPLTTIKDNEVYAPNFKNGETVALVRYPHGGTFEIPILRVNNKNAEGQRVLSKNPKDAVGINKKVADRLSGADFDGDTVMVIPCNSPKSKVRITSTPQLDGLKDFDPKVQYGGKPEGTFKKMRDTQKQMGVISNLITDMTLKGATNDELERAVRHSMVVIDAEKHGLDYKASERDNGIAALKKTYQGHYAADGRYKEGASTLISRAKHQERILKRVGSPMIDKETGEVSYKQKEERYIDKNGKEQIRTQKVPLMSITKDARTLSSGTKVEEAYARYANELKSMANEARKEAVNMKTTPVNRSAAKTYAKEVSALNTRLNESLKNAPRERQAQMIANTTLRAKIAENPDMSKADKKKVGQQALESARRMVGAKRTEIELSDREWEAIQAGAVSTTTQLALFRRADQDKLKERAMPRASSTKLSDAKIAKINAMKASGHTNDEIANALGVSASTILKYL